jgi:aspartate/glutamate/aspartate-prephenate aminotransferase
MLTPQQLRAALTARSRLLILCTPSNPTGAVYSLQRLQVTPSYRETYIDPALVSVAHVYNSAMTPCTRYHSMALQRLGQRNHSGRRGSVWAH